MPLDKQAVLERLDDDQELYQEICDIYRTDAPQIVARLHAAIEQRNASEAASVAHALKSASANIGATSLAGLARQAEIAGKNTDLQSLESLLPVIEQQLRETLMEIELV